MSVQHPSPPLASAPSSPISRQNSKAKGRYSWAQQKVASTWGVCAAREVLSFKDGEWEVPKGYDFTKSTQENYTTPNLEKESCRFHGEYTDVRATRDFNYHGMYTRERQLFQGALAHACTCCFIYPPTRVLPPPEI